MPLERMNYADKNNWIRFEENPTKPVDAFWIYGTMAQVSDLPNGRAEMTPPLRQAISFMGNRMTKLFEDSTNVYSFYYRQVSLEGAVTLSSGGKSYLDLIESSGVLEDVFDALDYYFENVNNGRPFILSGHSQGGAVIQKVLEIYMKKHPEYLERMIAAYAVGFSVTKTWLKENPHIKFAEGETDTGVMISWNTEGPNATKNNFTLQPKTVLINPINWKRDETPATVEENIASRSNNLEELMLTGKPFTMADLKEEVFTPGIADATLDLKRGAVICTTKDNFVDVEAFGDKSLHIGDWDFYFGNAKENMQKRIAAYFASKN